MSILLWFWLLLGLNAQPKELIDIEQKLKEDVVYHIYDSVLEVVADGKKSVLAGIGYQNNTNATVTLENIMVTVKVVCKWNIYGELILNESPKCKPLKPDPEAIAAKRKRLEDYNKKAEEFNIQHGFFSTP